MEPSDGEIKPNETDKECKIVDSGIKPNETDKQCEIVDKEKIPEAMEVDKKEVDVGTCSREDLLYLCDQRLLKRLFVCVIRSMDLVMDMSDSPLLPSLPVAVTWGIFHTLIAW